MSSSNITRQPTHRLYVVKGENEQARWIEIGAAWPNRDGQGFTFQLDAAPLDGSVVMREIAERGTQGGQQ